MLSKCDIHKLKSFIHVRKFETGNAKFKWPKKGKTSNTTEGKHNLLSLESKYRMATVVLPVDLPDVIPVTTSEEMVENDLDVNPPTTYEVI